MEAGFSASETGPIGEEGESDDDDEGEVMDCCMGEGSVPIKRECKTLVHLFYVRWRCT